MKKTLIIAVFAALATTAEAQPIPSGTSPLPNTPKNWITIVMTADVARNANETWGRIGGDDYCAFVLKYLGTSSCVLTVGTGDVGTNRLLNGTINELLVSRTSHSYVYAQPTSAIFYHGTMAVEPVDATHSRIIYTLLYDNSGIAPDARAAEMNLRRVRFQAAIDKAAAAANAP